MSAPPGAWGWGGVLPGVGMARGVAGPGVSRPRRVGFTQGPPGGDGRGPREEGLGLSQESGLPSGLPGEADDPRDTRVVWDELWPRPPRWPAPPPFGAFLALQGLPRSPPGMWTSGISAGGLGGEGWWHLGLKDLGHRSVTGERGRGAVCSGRPCGWRGRRPVLPPGSGQSAHLGDQGGSHLSPEGAGWLTGKETPTVAEGVA